MTKLKGGKLPRLADNLGFIQIKKINFTNGSDEVDSIIKSFLFKDKELINLKDKFNDIIETEVSDENSKQSIKNNIEKLLNKNEDKKINKDVLKDILNKSLTVIFKDLYMYDENFKNDADEKFVCDKSEGNISTINVSSEDLNSLNNLNKSKVKQHVKIILYKIISAISPSDKNDFILSLNELTKRELTKRKGDNEVFKKINEHTEKLFRFLYNKDSKKKGNLLNIYRNN